MTLIINSKTSVEELTIILKTNIWINLVKIIANPLLQYAIENSLLYMCIIINAIHHTTIFFFNYTLYRSQIQHKRIVPNVVHVFIIPICAKVSLLPVYICLLNNTQRGFLSCHPYPCDDGNIEIHTYCVCVSCARNIFVDFKRVFFDILLKSFVSGWNCLNGLVHFASLCIQCSKIIVTIVIYYRCICSVEQKKLFISNVIMNVFIMEKYTFFFAFSSMFVE